MLFRLKLTSQWARNVVIKLKGKEKNVKILTQKFTLEYQNA